MKNKAGGLVWGLAAAILTMAPHGLAQVAELKDDTGKTIIRYVAEAPEGLAPAGTTDPTKQVGLFLCMPEHDRPTGDELMPVRESLRRLGLLNQYVLVAASPQARKFGPADHEPIGKLIAWAKKTYPINPRRIYMYGKGEGGKISGEFVGLHPDLIAGAITYSWGFWAMPSEVRQPLKHAPEIYMVLGLQDLAHHLTTVRDAYVRVKAKGYHVIYREFEGLAARTYHPPSNDDAIRWASRLRNRYIAPSPQEKRLIESIANQGTKAPADGWFAGLALVGGAEAGAVVQKLLASEDANLRAAAANTVAQGSFDEATVAALGSRLSDASPRVRQAAIRALGIHANWRSPAAQKALVHFVTSPEAEAGERIIAVDALGSAVRMQVTGVRQDTGIFRTLVALQRDQNEEVRNMATAILLPARNEIAKFQTDPADRNSRTAAWTKWLEQVETKEAGYLKDYEACGDRGAASNGAAGPEDLFCRARNAKDPETTFRDTLRSAELGYVPAQAAVGMMYANGTGVEQNYEEAGKWWVKAAEGGHLLAAGNAALLYRNGEGVPRNRAVADQWAKYVEERADKQGR